MPKAIIISATSGIGLACAKELLNGSMSAISLKSIDF